MATRDAACNCGQLHLTVHGDPVRISLCRCLACQRRSGSAFAIQARFPAKDVHVSGQFSEYTRTSDAGEARTFRFCPDCGATVFYTTEDAAELIAVPVGAFADPSFPGPTVSVYESRRHSWVSLSADIQPNAPELWEPLTLSTRPVRTPRRLTEVVSSSRHIPSTATSSTTSRVARAWPAAPPTRSSIWAARSICRRASARLAADDADFDQIRNEPAFQDLVGG